MRAMLFGLCLCATTASPVNAADYPIRPVHIIVGLTAGSGVDIMARMVGQKLADAMGQPFIVENKPGAGSNIGTRLAAAAERDGYTIFVSTSPTPSTPRFTRTCRSTCSRISRRSS